MLCTFLVVLLGLGTVHCGGWGYGYGSYGGGRYGGGDSNRCVPPRFRGLVVEPLKRSYENGEVITISCEEGYELTRDRTNSTCMAFSAFGAYGAFVPLVSSQTCKELPMCRPPIEHGINVTPMKSIYDLDENITISCKEGYVMPDGVSSTYTCKDSWRHGAKFSVPWDVCQEIRDCRAPIQDGLQVEPFQNRYSPGSEITLTCDEGYELTVESTATCQQAGYFDFERLNDGDDDSWDSIHYVFSNHACKKKAKCNAPDYPGLVVTPLKSSYATGDEITLSCEEGYELTAPNRSVCGYEEKASRGHMFNFFYFLDRMSGVGNFEPRVKSRTCRPTPKCFAYHERGAIITPEKRSYEMGETIEVSCMDGYELVGESTRTCERDERDDFYHDFGYFHQYSHAHFKPDMHNVCKKKEACRNPEARGVVLTPKKTAYDIGETVAISCEPGYVLEGKNESTCESRRRSMYGRFSPDIDSDVCEKIPSCDKPTHEGLIVSPEKDYYEIGDKVSISCEEGYEQRVASMSTCIRKRSRKDGTFDPSLGREPCRKPTSCQAPSGANLTVTPAKENYEEGDEITLSCPDGYRRMAPESMTCERARDCRGQKGDVTGCFHPPAPRVACVKKEKCKLPRAIGLIVTPEKEAYDEGDMVTLSCEEGYDFRPSYDTAVCKTVIMVYGYDVKAFSMEFRPSIRKSICRKKPTCDAPKARPGLIVDPQKEEYFVGDEIELSCAEGYQLVGNDRSECVTRITMRFFGIRERRTSFSPSLGTTRCTKLEEVEPETAVTTTIEPETEHKVMTSTTEWHLETTTEPTPPPTPNGKDKVVPEYPENAEMDRA